MTELIEKKLPTTKVPPPSGYRRIAEVLDVESDLFIASEFVFSSDVGGQYLGAPPAETKLGRLIQQHYVQFPTEGSAWIGCSGKMKSAIGLLRKNLARLPLDERTRELQKFVEVSDPPFLDSIQI